METESFECLLESDAYEMYQDMMKKDPDNPMMRFLSIKVACWQYENGRYQESINTIKTLFKRQCSLLTEKSAIYDLTRYIKKSVRAVEMKNAEKIEPVQPC